MACCSMAHWPTKEIIAGIKEHMKRYDADPAYRKRVNEEGARRTAAYKKHIAMLDALVAAGKSWPP